MIFSLKKILIKNKIKLLWNILIIFSQEIKLNVYKIFYEIGKNFILVFL